MTDTEAPPAHRVKTSLPPSAYDPPTGPLATFLGLFSLGLGLAEAVAPHALGRLIGVHSPGLLRGYGLREIAAGAGILASDRPAGWLWARVAGDALDLATLAAAYAAAGPADRRRIAVAAAAVGGVTALDVLCAQQYSRAE